MRFKATTKVDGFGLFHHPKSDFPESLSESLSENPEDRLEEVLKIFRQFEDCFINLAFEDVFTLHCLSWPSEAHRDHKSWFRKLCLCYLNVEILYKENSEFRIDEFQCPLDVCNFAVRQFVKTIRETLKRFEAPFFERVRDIVLQEWQPTVFPITLLFNFYHRKIEPSKDALIAATHALPDFWERELREMLATEGISENVADKILARYFASDATPAPVSQPPQILSLSSR